MRKSLFVIITLITLTSTIAQLDLPRLSPKASAMQVIGYTTITIEYSRPSVYERKSL